MSEQTISRIRWVGALGIVIGAVLLPHYVPIHGNGLGPDLLRNCTTLLPLLFVPYLASRIPASQNLRPISSAHWALVIGILFLANTCIDILDRHQLQGHLLPIMAFIGVFVATGVGITLSLFFRRPK